jgi:hypothetical protein
MRRFPHALVVLLAGVAVAMTGCGGPLEPVASEGAFSALTYNVAGLPQGLSGSDPERTIPLISPLLNAWDLVLVQEDFAFQRELREDVELPYQSYPKETDGLLGDGLNRFSTLAFEPEVQRHRWEACNGLTDDSNDCLAEKGFSLAQHEIGEGILLWVVNLHMDAGGGEENAAARAAQVEQLISTVEEIVGDDALLVAGDTNTRPSRDDADDASILERLTSGLGVDDVCAVISCGEEDRIDRFFLRSTASLSFGNYGYRLATELVDDAGGPLSDHEGVEVTLDWTYFP